MSSHAGNKELETTFSKGTLVQCGSMREGMHEELIKNRSITLPVSPLQKASCLEPDVLKIFQLLLQGLQS